MAPQAKQLRRFYTMKDKLSILMELEMGTKSCKAVARQYMVQPCQLRGWMKKKQGIMAQVASIDDCYLKNQYLMKKTLHLGRTPLTTQADLERSKTVFDDLRERDRIVSLSLLAHDLRRRNVDLKDLSVRSVRRRVARHLAKHGVVRRRITRVAQNTRYDMAVKQEYVDYINQQIKVGNYQPEDIASIDETNFDFDQKAGETLATRGQKTIAQAVSGSANRATVLLGVTMSGEKLPPYIIFKGKDTRGSRVWKEFATPEARAKFGYPEGALYAVQPKAWMDEKRFLDWIDRVWKPWTKRPEASPNGSYMLQDEFKVHMMASCLKAVQDCGSETDFVVGGYTGCVQVMDKGLNRPFKGYSREGFEDWMLTNFDGRQPTRGQVATWIVSAWDKITKECIVNTWRSVGHFVPGRFGDPSLASANNPSTGTAPVAGVTHGDNDTDDYEDADVMMAEEGEDSDDDEAWADSGSAMMNNLAAVVDNLALEAPVADEAVAAAALPLPVLGEPLFGNSIMDDDDDEPLFVMELSVEERAKAKAPFPNGKGELDALANAKETQV
jgi:hypothetical protein